MYLPIANPRVPTMNLFLSSFGSHQESVTLSTKSDLCQLVLMRRVFLWFEAEVRIVTHYHVWPGKVVQRLQGSQPQTLWRQRDEEAFLMSVPFM